MLMATSPAALAAIEGKAYEDEPDWIAAYLETGMARKAQYGIEKLGFGTFLPVWVETIDRGPRGQRFAVHSLLGPYILIALQPDQADEWSAINDVKGVGGVLATSGKPLQVSGREVSRLMIDHATGQYNRVTYRRTKNTGKAKRQRPNREQRKQAAKIKKLRKLRKRLDRALAAQKGF